MPLKEMMAPEVSNCCGFSLKHGTIIIGVVQSVLSFMGLVLAAVYADNPKELLDMSDPSVVPDFTILKTILIILAVGSGLHCVFSIMLIFGAETNRPLMLIPWLILYPLGLVFYIICTLIAIIHHSHDNRHFFISAHLFIAAILSLIAGFKIVVVRSFYKHLKSLNF